MAESLADSLYGILSDNRSNKTATATQRSLIDVSKHVETENISVTQTQDKSAVPDATQGVSRKLNVYIPPHRRHTKESDHETNRKLFSPSEQHTEHFRSSRNHLPSADHSDFYNLRKDQDSNKESRKIPDSKYVRKEQFSGQKPTSLKERTFMNYLKPEKQHLKTENFGADRSNWLENLEAETSLQILGIISQNLKQFETILKQTLKPDLLYTVFKVIVELCSLERNDTVITTISCSCNKMFINQLSNYILQHIGDKQKIILGDIIVFLKTVTELFPMKLNDDFQSLFIAMDMWIRYCEEQELTEIDNSVKHTFEHAKILYKTNVEKQISEVKKKKNDKVLNIDVMPKENFRELNVFPTTEDILAENPSFIRPNIVNGSYESVEHYLDIQFRLMREDFLAPLREGISEFRNTRGELTKRINNVRIFNKVWFLKPRIDRHNFGLIVSFDPNNYLKNIIWEQSKWFMFGSLLLFSRDNFNTIIFATVVNRDISRLKKGQIVVQLKGQTSLSNDLFRDEFVMAESVVFFDPYYQILKALCNMSEATFPMKEYIINLKQSNSTPSYIKHLCMNEDIKHFDMVENEDIKHFDMVENGDIKHFDMVENEETLPDHEKLELDESQHTALRSALTKELVIIQGPPGTGKTFLGLEIAKILLNNYSFQRGQLLVLCYTNHALDQFLEHLLPITKQIVRVGGQSKNETLQEFTLTQKRELRTPGTTQLLKLLNYQINLLVSEMRAANDSLESVSNGIVSYSTLKFYGILNQNDHFDYTDGSSDGLVYWLMNGMYYSVTSEEKEIDKTNKIQHRTLEDMNELRTVHIEWRILKKEIKKIKIEHGEDYDYDYNFFECRLVDYDDCSCNRKRRCYNCRMQSYIRDDLLFLREEHPHLWWMVDRLMMYDVVQPFYSIDLSLNIKALRGIQKQLETEIRNIERSHLKDPSILNYLRILQQRREFFRQQIGYVRSQIGISDIADREFINTLEHRDWQHLESEERWVLYRYWIEQLKTIILNNLSDYKAELGRLTAMYDEVRYAKDLNILKECNVVGMTTTTAARLRPLLQNLNTPSGKYNTFINKIKSVTYRSQGSHTIQPDFCN